MQLNSEIKFSAETDNDGNVYYVIGNFATLHDQRLDKIFNIQSGLSEQAFYTLFGDFAERYDMTVEYRCTDAIVLKGPPGRMRTLAELHGSRFSYAQVDEQGVDSMLKAEVDYRISDDEPAYLQSPYFGHEKLVATLDA